MKTNRLSGSTGADSTASAKATKPLVLTGGQRFVVPLSVDIRTVGGMVHTETQPLTLQVVRRRGDRVTVDVTGAKGYLDFPHTTLELERKGSGYTTRLPQAWPNRTLDLTLSPDGKGGFSVSLSHQKPLEQMDSWTNVSRDNPPMTSAKVWTGTLKAENQTNP